MDGFLRVLSAVLGWTYFFLWSISFYPQPILNHERKSVAGTTIDFPLINSFGYVCLLATNLAFYASPLIRAQYAARYHGLTPTVRLNDIAFALHALLISILTLSQYSLPRLWRFPPTSSSSTRPSRFILGCIAGGTLSVTAFALLVLAHPAPRPALAWCELDLVYAVGYVKVLVTLVKYAPQILANRRNRSTRGWSIWQILLDVGGGAASIAQLGIDSYLQRDWSGVTGNPVKLAIGNASVFFDCVFMFQHYVLYREDAGRKEDDGDGERARLLDAADDAGFA
ncbi:Cystinosin -like protein [Escovopsis weberi]|uniref:Cystinosin-like protein n=1 Tax=Escovopsis weberi TaxID=150374 RepID=A0A0M8N346_ESCWE|nr:Cystinosin -like protein [Escovopsis weberi]